MELSQIIEIILSQIRQPITLCYLESIYLIRHASRYSLLGIPSPSFAHPISHTSDVYSL
jgi:hypothetical protein